MSILLEQRLAAHKKETSDLRLIAESALHEKGVLKASAVVKDVDKLVAITEGVSAVVQKTTTATLPIIGKQLMIEAASYLNSNKDNAFITGVNLACAYGAIVNETTTVAGVCVDPISAKHKRLLEEAAKEFNGLSEAGKSVVALQFQGLPTMLVSEAVYNELAEAGVELLQEAKAESQALSYIQKNLAPLKTTVKRIPQLKELNKVLTSFDKRIQGMISGQIPQSKVKSFIGELSTFYSAMQEFTGVDLPTILESGTLEKAKETPDKPLNTLFSNGTPEHQELYNMIYGRLQPNDGAVVGFIKKLFGKPLNLAQVMKMNGANMQQMAADFINLSFDQLTTLSQIGLTSGKDLMQSNFLRKFNGLAPDAQAQNSRVQGQQGGQANPNAPTQPVAQGQQGQQGQVPPQVQQQIAQAGGSPEKVTDVIKQNGQNNVQSVEQMKQQVNGVVDRIIQLDGVTNDKENRKRIIAALFDLE